jgi:DNA-binding PadR family transcriptional regulator
MSLPHALLTALIEHPSSGIELSGRFDRSIGFYWHATHQQIYRELARLETAGWVQVVPTESARGRKKLYQVLPAGRDELRRWAGQAHDPAPLRNELMLRMRAEATIGPTGLAADIERRLPMHQARLKTFMAIEKRDFSALNPSRAAAIKHLILKTGIMNETMAIDWSQQALAVLRREEHSFSVAARTQPDDSPSDQSKP